MQNMVAISFRLILDWRLTFQQDNDPKYGSNQHESSVFVSLDLYSIDMLCVEEG